MPAKKTKSKASTDAIAMLEQDHEKVRGLLDRLEKASGARRTKLLTQVEQELKVHTQIEEEIFYPAYRDAARKKDDKKLYFEALEEHHVVDLVLPEMNDGDTAEALKAKAKVLKELVEHHADEEEKEMFPRARKALGRDELRELAERIEARKEQLSR